MLGGVWGRSILHASVGGQGHYSAHFGSFLGLKIKKKAKYLENEGKLSKMSRGLNSSPQLLHLTAFDFPGNPAWPDIWPIYAAKQLIWAIFGHSSITLSRVDSHLDGCGILPFSSGG